MSKQELQKPRILAVDDSRVMRRAMSKILSAEYDVVEVENGEDAWTVLLNDNSIKVVFTDLNMPFLDGFGLLTRMRESEDTHLNALPVIIITGKDDDDDTKQEARLKGANDFITKPFDSMQLQAKAKAHVTLKQPTATSNSQASVVEVPPADINILELLEKLKENKPEELLPQIDSILYHIKPLLKFLAINARDKLQITLREISKK